MENWHLLVLRSIEDTTTCALPTDETDIQGSKPICIRTWTNHYSSKKLLILTAIYSSLTQNLCKSSSLLHHSSSVVYSFGSSIRHSKMSSCWWSKRSAGKIACNWSLPVWFSYYVRCKTYSYSSCYGSCADLKYSAYFCTLQAVIEIWNWKTYMISPSWWLSIAYWHQAGLIDSVA